MYLSVQNSFASNIYSTQKPANLSPASTLKIEQKALASVPLNMHRNIFFGRQNANTVDSSEKFKPIGDGYNFEYEKDKNVQLYKGKTDKILWINSDDNKVLNSVLSNIELIKQNISFKTFDKIQYAGKYYPELYADGKRLFVFNTNEKTAKGSAIYEVDKASIWNKSERYNYGSQPENNFFVLRPDAKKDKNKLLIYVHGGAFTKGTAINDYDEKLYKTFLRNGYTVATVDYRNMKTNPFYRTIDDIRRGITSAHSLLADGKQQVLLSGLSAGAVACELLLYSNQYPSIPKIDKFLGLAGGFGTVSDKLDSETVRDSEEKRTFSSLLTGCKEGDQPKTTTEALLIAGQKDGNDKFPDSENSRNAHVAKLIKSGQGKAECVYSVGEWGRYSGHSGPQDAITGNDSYIMPKIREFLGDKDFK